MHARKSVSRYLSTWKFYLRGKETQEDNSEKAMVPKVLRCDYKYKRITAKIVSDQTIDLFPIEKNEKSSSAAK
jgi:hypothetical protein